MAASFATHGYARISLADRCSLCNDRETHPNAFANPCGHGFHKTCIEILNPDECPACQKILLAIKYIEATRDLEGRALDQERCSVCYSPLNQENTCITICGHFFHISNECLPRWLKIAKSHPSCPDCNAHMPLRGVWKVIRNYLSYEQQNYIASTIVGCGFLLGLATAIIGICLLSTQIIAVGGIVSFLPITLYGLYQEETSAFIVGLTSTAFFTSLLVESYLLGAFSLISFITARVCCED